MKDCVAYKKKISGESGINCMGVCGKSYHLSLQCSRLDRYGSNIFDTCAMIRFMCDDCMLYISNVDMALKDIHEMIKKNGNKLQEYKSEFNESLKSNELEIKNSLVAIEARYSDRLKVIQKPQEVCEKSEREFKKMSGFSKSFKEHSEKLCNKVEKMSEVMVRELKHNEKSAVSAENNKKN